jgi:bifunctional non-homologous end joining protein LigD
MTLEWNELKSTAAPVFHVADFEQWRSRLNRDPWKAMLNTKQRLTEEILRDAGLSSAKKSPRR